VLDVGPASQAVQCENHYTVSNMTRDVATRKPISEDWQSLTLRYCLCAQLLLVRAPAQGRW
jgi:hypothetical protein